jgi:microsomal prostaglandin-E synthase 2
VQAQGKIKKKYAIDDERASLRTAINLWLVDGVAGKPFAGGDVPHFGDVCVYGCLKAIDRTSAYTEMMAETTELRQWYQRMAEIVGESKGKYATQ